MSSAKSPGFESPPPPIPDKDIKERLKADVIVVGSGIAGLTAAASAAEAGAGTILLEKGPGFSNRGLHNAALASHMQQEAGACADRDRVISTIMEFGAYRTDQKIVNVWADNCDTAMNWLLDMAAAAGRKVVLDTTSKPWYFPNYPIAHAFVPGAQEALAAMLQEKARALGAELRYNTPVVRLIRQDNGRVTGIIARNERGEYLQIDAGAVVLCTGDYGGDREMVRKYCEPAIHDLKCAYEPVYDPPLNTGDGHKMAMWLGAAIDEPPHCAMVWDWTVWAQRGLFNLARQPWLYVNLDGVRFMNEDLPWGYECNQILQQPGGHAWSVWDDKYDDEIPKLQSQCCKNMGQPTFLWDPKQLEEALAAGNVIKAASLDELAEKTGLPAAFKATVARYNELAKQGKDADFGKYPTRLTTIAKPPFYACKMEARYMVILGGLKVNTDLQVMDTQRRAIPGLYAAGNTSGSFFGSVYPTTVPGLTHSRAWTFGRLAGQNAARESKIGR